MIQSPIYIDTFNALGANAVPMPFPEVYTALEQKTIDGQENPYTVIEANKFQEVQKFLAGTRHIYNPQTMFDQQEDLGPPEQGRAGHPARRRRRKSQPSSASFRATRRTWRSRI